MARVSTSFVFVCVTGLVMAGCSSSRLLDNPLFERDTYNQLFARKINLFKTPEWAKATVSANNVHLTPKGPVPAAELVSANGTCAPKAAAAPKEGGQTAQAAAPVKPRPVGSVAGDLAGAPMPLAARQRAATTGSASTNQVEPEGGGGPISSSAALLGGPGLDMTECEVVRRAGTPENVVISRGRKGQRKVVLSYLGGDWPGIYHFRAGRLREIDATPEQLKQAAAAQSRQQALQRRRAVRGGTDRYYVQ